MENVEFMLASYGLAWGLLLVYLGFLHVKIANLDRDRRNRD